MARWVENFELENLVVLDTAVQARTSPFSLVGRRALVVGASGGENDIGMAIGAALAQQGAAVTLLIRTASAVARAYDRLHALQPQSKVIHFNLGEVDAIERMFAQAVYEAGGFDVFTDFVGDKDAATPRSAPAGVGPDVSLDAFSLLAHSFARDRIYRRRPGSVIVVAGSVHLSARGAAGPTMAPRIHHIIHRLALDWGLFNIRVNGVVPGQLEIPGRAGAEAEPTKPGANPEVGTNPGGEVPLGYRGRAEQLASTVAFLASDAASYITGQIIHVDGGCHMAKAPP